MSQTALYVSPPPTAPLLHEPQLNLLPDPQTFTRQRAISMFDRQSSSIVGTYAGADLRPLRMPKREKGRVMVKNAPWNWGGDSETHPYLLATPSRSVTGVWGHTSRPYPMEPPVGGRTAGRCIKTNSFSPFAAFLLVEIPLLLRSTSTNPSSSTKNPRSAPPHPTPRINVHIPEHSPRPNLSPSPTPPNLKSRSETTLGKHKSKLTPSSIPILVTESLEVDHDVDAEEDYRPRTRRGPPDSTCRLPTRLSSDPIPGSLSPPSSLSTSSSLPLLDLPLLNLPSPASFYSASSSPHSDPGYDSDSTSTVEAKAEGQRRMRGSILTTPSPSQRSTKTPTRHTATRTLGTIGSIGSIGTVGDDGNDGHDGCCVALV
ncbi:hypothetical protein FA13DRAFT_1803259 [Coprinellus micaceus]|uniref:Uncharacterized protein n=1 Tax=Coprinellus micaceus TaxID=71717 RepID=A0A4Y7SAI0_COPMI|nr:hypothetical protein FA13DRAFT_1803259 [Coprinellus micaceus]